MIDCRVVFHIDELGKWPLLLSNVKNLVEALDKKKYSIEVLANGEAVRYYDAAQNAGQNYDRLQALSDIGIDFVACNNAITANKIDRSNILTIVRIVPAGVLELVEKQNEGFAYIKP